MVSQITTGYPTDHNGRPYKRRNARAILILLAVLVVLGIIAWSVALAGSDSDTTPTACNEPTPASTSASATATATQPSAPAGASATPSRTVVNRDQMLSVAPAALSTFQVRVLNASTQRGEAQSVSNDLTAQGFTPASDTAFGDDPIYPNHDLDCVAQIRFGPAGQAAAASVWLAIPCAQLINDGRRGTDVDVALGEYYKPREQSQDAQAALEALRSADPKNPQAGVDPGLVKAVHAQPC
ncbi:envelope integrity protein Cei [Gordonia polyisoprenivorans]|uniref:envelope integrity protein Cei n=1 Tax=Gordonia polyisoprenivorans TaxID=84595 RepID=UPI001B8AE6CE|nr:envelope integrity protein Cei [Gordonia polyisoprenivorans]QUD85303.1 envelope integrity protein Cei [Gordonia polyisoprenivorans]